MKSLKWNSIRHMLSRYSGIEFTQRQKNTNRRTITNEMKRKKNGDRYEQNRKVDQ